LDETSTRQKRNPDNAEPTPGPKPDREPSDEARPNAGEPAPQVNHPDGPDHPTTPYDHIWYDRRPLH